LQEFIQNLIAGLASSGQIAGLSNPGLREFQELEGIVF